MTIGAQLYTLRTYTQNERDLAETLARVAKMGYETIQVSAVGPIPAETIKKLADDNGLKIVLTHIPEPQLLTDIDGVIRAHQTYECKYVGLGAMSDRYRDAAWIDRFATDFQKPMEALKAAGMKFMYHNHAFEFERLRDGRFIIDILQQIPEDLMGITLDTYWVQFAGGDIYHWIKQLAPRLHCVHLKDMAPKLFESPRMAAIGQGNMNFAAIIDLLKELNCTEHLLVEQDNCYGDDPFDCMKKSIDCVRALV